MGSHHGRPPLLIRPRLSRRLALFAILTHGLALCAVLTLPLDLLRPPLLLLVGASGLYVGYVQVLRRAPWSIRTALWRPDGTWLLTLGSGAERQATLSPSTFLSLPLVVLNFRSGRLRRHALPLFADALDPDQMRRLRQRLRMDGDDRDQAPAGAQDHTLLSRLGKRLNRLN